MHLTPRTDLRAVVRVYGKAGSGKTATLIALARADRFNTVLVTSNAAFANALAHNFDINTATWFELQTGKLRGQGRRILVDDVNHMPALLEALTDYQAMHSKNVVLDALHITTSGQLYAYSEYRPGALQIELLDPPSPLPPEAP